MTADVELLPCPWCGGKIEGNMSEGSTFRWRKVDGCCADGPEVRHNTTAPDQGIAEHESRIAAIKAWNTRAATAAKDAEIEALRAEVERLTLEMGRLQQQYDERTACMILHRGQALACSDAVRAAYFDESRRADKLWEEVGRLQAEVERLQEVVRPKREDECLTLDHWRMRAYALEANWSRCSRACAVEQTKREQAEARAERLAEALRWAERHCPCGARPESPNTHPHVPGCPIGAALHPTAAQDGGNACHHINTVRGEDGVRWCQHCRQQLAQENDDA